MNYQSTEHKAKYASILKDIHKPIYQMTPEFLSALFLLSSNNKLWGRSKNAVIMNEIDFTKIHIAGINTDGYTLIKIAQDLFEDTCHIDFNDLGNTEVINNKIFRLIKSALQIKRDGCCALKLNLKGDIDI